MFLDDKGQASAEILLVSLIAVIIIGGFASTISSSQDKTQTGNIGGARALGEKIASTVDTVYVNGNGYTIDLDLRSLNQALSTPTAPYSFTATLSNATGLVVTTGSTSVNLNVIPRKFNGTTTLNNNGYYHITNVNNTIQITT